MITDVLQSISGRPCPCGKTHRSGIDTILSGSGVAEALPDILRKKGIRKPFVLCDKNTFRAAGERVCSLLGAAGLNARLYMIGDEKPDPDEKTSGAVIMHFDTECDAVVGVGSGVVNDVGKLVSAVSGRPYAIVATAPSMDGYASATSSMTRDGLKVSVRTRCADVIIGDTDIMKEAPLDMLRAGLGDMLAKYVALAEWRISHVINGEEYCEATDRLVRTALEECVSCADGLVKRDEKAVRAVFDGLVLTGAAMTLVGASRPASGVEHYISHIWDMRGEEFGTPRALHGIQCAVGTLAALRLYGRLRKERPDREKALAYVRAFEYDK